MAKTVSLVATFMRIISKMFLLLLLLTACGTKPSPVSVETYPNGNKKVIHTYPNDKDKSTYQFEYYNEDGQILKKGQVVNGLETGKYEWWYGNGRKKDEAYFVKGQYCDKRIHWYENGNLKELEFFYNTIAKDEDCPIGNYIYYYKNGGLKQVKYKDQNIELDRTFFYHPDGSTFQTDFRNGLEHGPYYEIYSNKNMLLTGAFSYGKKDGEWTWYYPSGAIRVKAAYKNGEPVGTWTWYDENGKITKQEN